MADSTPKELRRLVEFLNEEMANVKVLAVEVKQFRRESGTGQTALVPRVVGLTEAAREKTSRPRKQKLTKAEFLDECTPVGRQFFGQVLRLAQERRHTIYWGTAGFSIRAFLPDRDQLATFAYGYPATVYSTEGDRFDVYFAYTNLFPAEEAPALRESLLESGLFRKAGNWTLSAPVTEESLDRMYEIYDFLLDRVDEFVAHRESKEESE